MSAEQKKDTQQTDIEKLSTLQQFFISLSRMPPGLMLMIIMGLAISATLLYINQVEQSADQRKEVTLSLACETCHTQMEKGFLLEETVPGIKWSGEPRKAFFNVGKSKSLNAYRCINCGHIELYAP